MYHLTSTPTSICCSWWMSHEVTEDAVSARETTKRNMCECSTVTFEPLVQPPTIQHRSPQSSPSSTSSFSRNQILHVLLAQLGSLWGGQVVANVVCKFCCNLRLDVGGWVVISANKVRRKHHHIPTSFNIKYSLCQSAFAAWLLWAKSKNKCGAVHVSKTLNYVFTEAYLRPDST